MNARPAGSAADANSRSVRDERAIEQAAAGWVLRHQAGLGLMDRFAFRRWLRADERHAEIFSEMDETSTLLGGLHDPSLAGAHSKLVHERRPAAHLVWRPVWALAAAAVVAIGGWSAWRQSGPTTAFAETVVTQVGGLRKIDLPDGSVAQLNTDTAMEVHYTPAERRVRLVRGEVHFTVAANPARPFVVEARGVAVRAIGTAFDVRLRTDAVEVFVTHGKVEVDDAKNTAATRVGQKPDDPATRGTPFSLVAGQRVLVAAGPAGGARIPVAADAIDPVEMKRLLAWQERRLEFSSAPLSEVVAEFNRHNRHQLVIVDSKLAAQRFGGAFAAQGDQSFVELLQQNFGVVAERRENETILRRVP